MQRRVVGYNEERARAGYAPIAIGIGLHIGDLMLGTIGEERRFETTVIADAVNVAARLESLTKTFGSLILASGQIMERVDGTDFLTRRLGDVQVVGTTRGVTVIEICDADPPEKSGAQAAHRRGVRTQRGRSTARGRDFAGAHRAVRLRRSSTTPPTSAAVYFRDRAAIDGGRELGAAWDGVERMDVK